VYYVKALKGDRIELGNCNLVGAFSSDTTISTPVAINKGGTGQTTAQAALDALAAASGTLVRGDIFYVDASLNVVRLARGSDNQVLKMSGSDVNWETLAAAGVTTNTRRITGITNNASTTSSTLVSITGTSSVALSDQTGGIASGVFNFTAENNSSGSQSRGAIDANDGLNYGCAYACPSAGYFTGSACSFSTDTDGDTVQLQFACNANTTTIHNGGTYDSSVCIISEVY